MMSRAVFESHPITTEIELRLRRVEERLARMEAPQQGETAPEHPGSPRWAELGTQLDALALKLKLHYEQAGGDGVPRALRELPDSVREAFTAAGSAVHDDAVRADVRNVGVMIAEAVADGLSAVSTDLREALQGNDFSHDKSPDVGRAA
jgi:hypothetical protein